MRAECREIMMNPTPYVMSLEPGSYYFCACRHSANRPFCDGTHKSLAAE
ncbi:MAG: CDGSH iron-sulfur domain-containing protein [Acidithiobacillus sp.]